MTPHELKSIRQALSLTAIEFGKLLGYHGTHIQDVVYQLESGRRTIREPQQRLAIAYLSGYRSGDWPKGK